MTDIWIIQDIEKQIAQRNRMFRLQVLPYPLIWK